ncbi:MAG: tRNA dihydrouridine(20/20a) synthase DusA [Gammaproteobacteria bacterium]
MRVDPNALDRTFCCAPMMECTDRHFRYFLRLISRRTLLYTEMITTGALLHGDRERFLAYDPLEHPLALQLGGSAPTEMAACARFAEDHGFDEVNINVGCPSDRVQSGQFGACLMAQPELVAQCVAAMRASVSIPVTVKSRIGIDDQDSYEHLQRFTQTVIEGGCHTLIVHARKAYLQGLSPRENRDLPPLRYDVVYRLKRDFPQLEVIVNGGIKTLAEAKEKLEHVDGVMLGREAYQNPYVLADVDHEFFADCAPQRSRREVLEAFVPYIEAQLARGVYLSRMSRHILGLFQGQPGARAWRRYLSEHAYKRGAGVEVLRHAASLVSEPESLARAS